MFQNGLSSYRMNFSSNLPAFKHQCREFHFINTGEEGLCPNQTCHEMSLFGLMIFFLLISDFSVSIVSRFRSSWPTHVGARSSSLHAMMAISLFWSKCGTLSKAPKFCKTSALPTSRRMKLGGLPPAEQTTTQPAFAVG